MFGVLVPVSVTSAQQSDVRYEGRSVVSVLTELRDGGLDIAWSSLLVPSDLVVADEPDAGPPEKIAAAILAPYDLALQAESGLMIVIRGPPAPMPEVPDQTRDRTDEIETITVSASRYEISRATTVSTFILDRQTIESMPDVGDDPIRITHRLPGAAASGTSARVHLRGGEQGEVSLILNGQRLLDPFHVRDYQSIFSAIDSRAIRGVEVYTGGFPVPFGDRMSGVVLMESIDARDSPRTELGLSVFNTSLLHAGSREDSRWLVSARRGNLDLVIDPQFGRPKYYDVFAQYEVDLTQDVTLTTNALYADDRITLVLESDPDEREQSTSRTRNAQFWIGLENRWSERLSSQTLLSLTGYSNRRDGSLNDPGKMIAAVADNRELNEFGIRQDWVLRRDNSHLLKWGFSVRGGDASYDYKGNADYFELQAIYEGRSTSIARNVAASPSGASYALYFADRRKFLHRWVVEWGLRFDDQTYTGLASDAQLSPRLSVLFALSERSELRLSWGRYHQSQGIHELQVEDGISQFWPAQRADHWIGGLRHRVSDHAAVRVEVFYKAMRDLRTRFENLYDPLGLIPELQPDRVRLEPSSARATGIELSANGERGDWSWWASYTLSKTTDKIDGVDVARSWDQRHAVQAGIKWSHDGWDLAVAGGVHSGWPVTGLGLQNRGEDEDGEPIFVAVPGPRNAERHPSFASLDVRLSRRFDVPRGSLMMFVEVSNVTDRSNICCIDWDLDEDSDTAPALESSPDYWLPLLPAVGVLWEF